MAEAKQEGKQNFAGAPSHGDGDHGLPFTPTREVTLSKATWERLEKEGYMVDLTQSEERFFIDTSKARILGSNSQPKDRIQTSAQPNVDHLEDV